MGVRSDSEILGDVEIFSDAQLENLVLQLIITRRKEDGEDIIPQLITEADATKFIKKCAAVKISGMTMEMAANGDALVKWDEDLGTFVYAKENVGWEAAVE